MLIHTNDSTMTIGLKENGEPLSVFIIDDSEAMVKIIARTLDSFGVKHIGSANDGNSAIEQLRILPEPVDLICLDITMPIKDGLSALPEIKVIQPKAKILMATALGDKKRVMQALQLGADYYVVKPFKKETLYAVLRKLFS